MAIRGDVIVKFKRRRSLRRTDAALGRAYKQVAKEMEREMKQKVSRLFPPASAPFRYPRRRTGRFRSGIAVTGTVKGITVSSVQPYGKWLEEGTANMRPRTWARRVLIFGANRKKWEARIAALAKKFSGGSTLRGRR